MVSNETVIEVDGVDFSYNGRSVLEDATFTIPELDFVGIVGPNAGGKTTLLKLLLGLLHPDSGTVRVFGRPPEQVRTRVGYVPQGFQFHSRFPITVRDVVLMGRLGTSGRPERGSAHGRADGPEGHEAVASQEAADVEDVLETVGLEEVAGRRFSELSGGQLQRALIARALMVNPEILMLDEPTASLDAAVEREIHELLQELNRNTTIVLVTHDLGFVSHVVKSVLCVNREVRRHPTTEMGEITGELMESMYGSDRRVVRHDQCWEEEGEECE